MLRKLALSASVLALAGSLAVAQAETMTNSSSGHSMAAPSSLSTMHWLASDIYKADVYDNAEEASSPISSWIITGTSRRQSLASAVFSALARRTWPFLSRT
jgi:hypothetical protein